MKGKMRGSKRFLREKFVISSPLLRVVTDSQVQKHDKYHLALCFFLDGVVASRVPSPG